MPSHKRELLENGAQELTENRVHESMENEAPMKIEQGRSPAANG